MGPEGALDIISTQRTNLGDVVAWLERHGIPAYAETEADQHYWKVPDAVLVTTREIFADPRVMKPRVIEFTGDWGAVETAAAEGQAALQQRFDIPLGSPCTAYLAVWRCCHRADIGARPARRWPGGRSGPCAAPGPPTDS
jgi:hypothetical protein